MCAGRHQGVLAELMSKPADAYLKENIPWSRANDADNIINRQKDGICPMEYSVLDEDDPEVGLTKIRSASKSVQTNRRILKHE